MKEVEPVPDKKMASGYTIPVLGLGTARMFQQTYEAVLYALKSGYRMIDTAQSYKYSEESISRAIKDSGVPREDIFLITKLAPKFFGFSSTKKSVDVSLEKLGTDYVDLFLIHSPDCQEEADDNDDDDSFRCPKDNPKASWEESWKAMEELHKEGKIRSLGVSNFFPKHLKKLVSMAEVPVSLVQNWFDPIFRDEATREFCLQHGIVYQGFSTLGTQWSEIIDDLFMANPILVNPTLHSLSISLDMSVPNIVLRWAIQKGVVVIPKAVTEKYILNNLNVLDIDLSEEVMTTIDLSITPIEIDEDGEPILDDAAVNRIMGMENPPIHIPDFRMPSGHTIPVFGLGTAGMMDKTYDLVLFALNAGYRMIDTAQSYYHYHSEEEVGRAIKDSGIPREDIFLVTKLAPRFFGHDLTLDSVQESLEKLGMDYIDLLLIHDQNCSDPHFQCAPDEPKGSWEESWKAMEELHNEGKVRSLGVSNFYPKHLEKLVSMAEVPVSVVQNWFDPFYRDEAMREFCEQHGIVYQGYSTLGGMWTDWMYRHKTVEPLKNPVLASPVLGKLSKILDIPVANIVLRWALQKGVVLIPKSTKEKHILSNLEVLQMELDELSFRVIEEKIAPVKINEDGQPSIYEDDDEWNRIIESADDGEQEEIQVQKDNKDQKRTNLFELVNLEDETIFIGSDDGKMYAFDGETGKVKWTFKTEEDLGSSPAFSPDRSVVYFGTEDGHVNALRATDGQVVWRYKTGGSVTCSPSVGADGTVYIGTLDNMMYAFTPDGAVKWSRDLGGEIWTHPALGHDGRLVYVGVMAETNFNAFALDSQTGTPAWSFKAAGPIWSAPILSQDGRYVYYSSRDSHVYTLRADSGSLVRKFDVGEDHDGVDSTPVINRDGTLFLATVGGSVMAVDIRRGKLQWEKMLGGEIMSSPVLDNDGYLYIGSGDGHLLKLKQKDGSVVWKFPAGEEVWSSPRLDKHGRVYIGSISGPVFCVDRETGRAVWSYETEGPVVATPQITTEHQYVYDYGQGTETKDEL
ncbi:AKR1B10 [Branchiostoma lanceolatum]|uniref:AKR1B10 protein n=1 Tax=Branchiostoma lanceolatum TaxID=7740 RepID=A0A8S4MMZ6_BRALA|nr:AKR1B10 [Branchiostoma lanceolatum]